MAIAEFIIGPAQGRTRWPHQSYGLVARMSAATCGSPGYRFAHPGYMPSHAVTAAGSTCDFTNGLNVIAIRKAQRPSTQEPI